MSWFSWLVWGFAATAVLTTLMAGSEGIGVTRMNIPHMLGTMFTPNRDRAKVYGAALHFLNGWAFSIVYVAAFHAAHLFTWWFGLAIGLVHAAFVLAVAAPVMPGVHPRMASVLRGPTVSRQLEPPGFLALNYGVRTPISVVIAHLAFGAILGGFYTPPRAYRNDCPAVVSAWPEQLELARGLATVAFGGNADAETVDQRVVTVARVMDTDAEEKAADQVR